MEGGYVKKGGGIFLEKGVVLIKEKGWVYQQKRGGHSRKKVCLSERGWA